MAQVSKRLTNPFEVVWKSLSLVFFAVSMFSFLTCSNTLSQVIVIIIVVVIVAAYDTTRKFGAFLFLLLPLTPRWSWCYHIIQKLRIECKTLH